MTRRRNDDGLIGEGIDNLFAISGAYPLAGFGIAAAFAATGAYFTWIKPTAMFGTGSLVGGIAFFCAAIFAFASILGFFRNRFDYKRRNGRLERVTQLDDLRKMSWREFEQLVADTFRRKGFRVQEVGGTGDGGVDLVLIGSAGLEFLVQCKQYRAWDVGEPKVREFYGAMAAHRTRCEGIVVTCGRFTGPARSFCVGKPIRLVDGHELVNLIVGTNPVTPAVQHFNSAPPPELNQSAPACPACGFTMVRRIATRGLNKGHPFWGCVNFPRCKQIINVRR
jgi:restriction system protein